jgi:hypothetical protein
MLPRTHNLASPQLAAQYNVGCIYSFPRLHDFDQHLSVRDLVPGVFYQGKQATMPALLHYPRGRLQSK